MSSGEALRARFSAASVSLDGELPQGDPRVWSHTLTDVVAAFIRDKQTDRVRDSADVELDPGRVETRVAQLREAGVRGGGVVVVEAYNTLQAVESMLAVWLLGCAVCPVDPDAPATVKALIAREAKADASVTVNGELILHSDVDGASGLIELRRPIRVTGPDLALVIFTSGSSGVPKGVLLSHENVMSALRAISTYLQLQPGDQILCVPPLFFDYGLYQLLLAMFNGCALTLNDRHTSAVMILKLIESSKATVLPVVPALAAALAKMLGVVGKQGPQVRLVTNTGGHLTQTAIAALRGAFPNATVMPMYGLTECKRAFYLDVSRFDAQSGAVGRPMPGLEARVLVNDAGNLREAASNEVGELYVRGVSVMQGYQSVDASEGARIVAGGYRADNWLATGDLFSVDEQHLFHFRGRTKSLIKQGGYCISPADVERIAEAHTDIVAARVVARAEESGDESAVLFLQAGNELSAPRKKQIVAELKQMIHKTLMPREVQFVEEWPATPNGKIDQRVLMERAASHSEVQ
ncbi:class I adenylate-forming enzyme family protein [Paraburkholderia fungorum]|uniref:class I adenylate-forming enzyme family protein n=1 Tax=Paraburkholderia fungorum TaxID=134537 RepID=UPI00402B60C9